MLFQRNNIRFRHATNSGHAYIEAALVLSLLISVLVGLTRMGTFSKGLLRSQSLAHQTMLTDAGGSDKKLRKRLTRQCQALDKKAACSRKGKTINCQMPTLGQVVSRRQTAGQQPVIAIVDVGIIRKAASKTQRYDLWPGGFF